MMASHERSRCDGLTCGMRRKAYLARPLSFEDLAHAQFEALIHAMAEHILQNPDFYADYVFWCRYAAFHKMTDIDILDGLAGLWVDPALRANGGKAAVPALCRALFELERLKWKNADFDVKEAGRVLIEVSLRDGLLSIRKPAEVSRKRSC
ncbi:hypothetical protein [Phaeovulum sp. NW3]|uniref:hypothetical protein n=1 Tax=Phaeovulum sp. NW3 TaxID=2934933 RepID=UPI002021BB36|nr:hypothetical protein [Phaeovulum sp. NW3]MCL7466375.1 hypothetical protein [Phaeovulum sp. NW3]